MYYSIFVGLGVVAGILSALLGIGGGQVLVPALVAILASSVPADNLMKTALATSLATIPFTGSWAAYQQNRAGNVDFAKVSKLAVGVIVGALIGGIAAPFASGQVLKGIFVTFAFYVGLQLLAGRHPRFKSDFNAKSAMIAGTVTGAFSSWVGIGGGAVVVPYLLAVGEETKKATGISSAVGVVVALSASIGYAWGAWIQHVNLPSQWGYIHLPAFAGIVGGSAMGVLVGMQLLTRVNAVLIKRLFAVTLLGAGIKMLLSFF